MTARTAPGAETTAHFARGAMLYDAYRLGQPTGAVFERDYWRQRGALEETAGGRGTIAFVTHGPSRWALRHYCRGGLMRSVSRDAYLWTGADRARSFREFRLLRQLVDWQLPVPVAVAARYVRAGLIYRADLLTEELPTRRTLAQALRDGPLAEFRWVQVGRLVGRLHARGVHHADLNAHNLLLGEGEAVYVLDFDRGRVRERGAWEQAVLQRLRRSLEKVTRGLPPDRFGATQWQWLLDGCAS